MQTLRRVGLFLLAGGLFGWAGCESGEPGTCKKDNECEGAEVCFEGKCMSMKALKELKEQRAAAEKPKVCNDKDGDGARKGDGCPAGTPQDCNDDDASMAPGKPELCDAIDNNCDGRNNEALKGCVQTLFGGATWGTQAGGTLDVPRGVVYDPAGFVLVTDNHRVWKVQLDGRASVLAGAALSNFAEGQGEAARFSYPNGMARLSDGSVLIADCKNNCVRKVSPSGTTSTVAGNCSNLTKDTGQYADGSASAARFYCPSSLAVGSDGSIYVVDQENDRIRKISAAGEVTTVAGLGPMEVEEGTGQIGFADGPAPEARFNLAQAILYGPKGMLYISEAYNCRIRKIDPAAKGGVGVVSTFAGESDTLLGVGGYQDGPALKAKFSYPHGMIFDPKGNFIIADTGNSVIRMLTTGGQVKTLYGKYGESKAIDGPIAAARFNTPADVALGPEGSLFVVDTAANRLRWIVP